MKATTAIIVIIVFVTGLIFGSLASGITTRTTILTEYRTTTIHEITGKTFTIQTTVTTTLRETSTITAPQEETSRAVSFVCFSRPEKCDTIIIDILDEAKRYVYVAVYSFTSDPLADVLIELKNRGVDVKVVLEEQQANVRGSEYERLKNAGVDIRIDGNPDLMHHKFAVIDDEVVITGSYNWSAAAEDKNDENLVVLRDEVVAQLYRKEFERVWKEAK
ncbi:MAG: phospholipase D family protein [Nitrososphaerota archaeon]